MLTPIFDLGLQQELKTVLDMQWRDNVKANAIGKNGENIKRQMEQSTEFRSQFEIYRYLGSWPQEMPAGSEKK